MLKCDLDVKKESARVEVRGSFLEITTDVTYIISHVYDAIKRGNPFAADAFKFVMKQAVDCDDSPVWNLNDLVSRQEDGIKSIDIRVPKDFTSGLAGYENAE